MGIAAKECKERRNGEWVLTEGREAKLFKVTEAEVMV